MAIIKRIAMIHQPVPTEGYPETSSYTIEVFPTGPKVFYGRITAGPDRSPWDWGAVRRLSRTSEQDALDQVMKAIKDQHASDTLIEFN